MSFTLVEAATPIHQEDSGLIVIRCEDYVAGARGGLSTVSDSLSVAGTVVKEEQALAVATTTTAANLTNRWASAANSVVIPRADLEPFINPEGTALYMFIGMKILGDVPSNARWLGTWKDHHPSGGGAMVAMGFDSDVENAQRISTDIFGDQYRIHWIEFFFHEDFDSYTNIVIRGWGVTGGDIAIYLDTVYLWPRISQDPFDDLSSFLDPWDYPPVFLGLNGTYEIDEDSNTSNALGEQSVTTTELGFSGDITFGYMDHQDSNEEATAYNITTFENYDGTGGITGWPLDPPSRISVGVGSHYLPARTLISDDFTGDVSWSAFSNRVVEGSNGYMKYIGTGFGFPSHSNGTSGFSQIGGKLRACWAANQGFNPANNPGGPRCDFAYGVYDFVGGSSTDPRNYRRTLVDLEDSIQEFTFNCDAHSTCLMVGWGHFHTGVPGIHDPIFGCRVDVTPGGVLQATLGVIWQSTVLQPAWYDSGSPVVIDGAYSGATYRIKIEKLRYRIRVKIWLDGGSEPGSWTLDGPMQIVYRFIGDATYTVRGTVDYPYSANWPGDVTHDLTSAFPPQDFGWGYYPEMQCYVTAASCPETLWEFDSYTLKIDPGSGSPVSTFLEEEKWDYSEQWGDIEIPWGSHRFVEGDRRKRKFDADTHGFNLRTWKDSGSPENQGAMVMAVLEQAYWELFQPQIYRKERVQRAV